MTPAVKQTEDERKSGFAEALGLADDFVSKINANAFANVMNGTGQILSRHWRMQTMLKDTGKVSACTNNTKVAITYDSTFDADNIPMFTGLFYHELGHIMFSPSAQKIIEEANSHDCKGAGVAEIKHIWNSMEDCRIENLLSVKFHIRHFLLEPYQKLILENKNDAKSQNSWFPVYFLLTYGRMHLPTSIRNTAYNMLSSEEKAKFEQYKNIVDRYLKLANDDKAGMVDLAIEAYEVVKCYNPVTLNADNSSNSTPLKRSQDFDEEELDDMIEDTLKEDDNVDWDEEPEEDEDENEGEDFPVNGDFPKPEDDDQDDEDDQDDNEDYPEDENDDSDDEDDQDDDQAGSGSDVSDDDEGEDEGEDGGTDDQDIHDFLNEGDEEEDTDADNDGEGDSQDGDGDGDSSDGDSDVSDDDESDDDEEENDGEGSGDGCSTNPSKDRDDLDEDDLNDQINKEIKKNDSKISKSTQDIQAKMNEEIEKNNMFDTNDTGSDLDVTPEMKTVIRRLTTLFEKYKWELRGGYKKQQVSGSLDLQRAFATQRQKSTKIFRQYKPDQRNNAMTDVFFALDLSISMEGSPIEEASKGLHILQASHINAGNNVYAYGFSDRRHQYFLKDKRGIKKGVYRQYKTLSGTDPLRVMDMIISKAHKSTKKNKIVIILSDGQFSQYADIKYRNEVLKKEGCTVIKINYGGCRVQDLGFDLDFEINSEDIRDGKTEQKFGDLAKMIGETVFKKIKRMV